MELSLFISAATSEFGSYRTALRHALERPDVSVKIQEDLYASGTPTLLKLDDYIRVRHAVIHLVGDICGSDAPAASVEALVARYPDLGTKVPILRPYLAQNGPLLTYTQWEAWLAHYHGKPLFVAVPTEALKRELAGAADEAQRTRQQRHLQTLQVDCSIYPDIEFNSLDQLSAALLKSAILDLLVNAALSRRQPVDSRLDTEVRKQQERSGIPLALFRHLWEEWGGREELLYPLANAVKARVVEPLATTPGSDPQQGQMLLAAWLRVRLVEALYPLANKLDLTPSRWQGLTRWVADHDARAAPGRLGLHELLLWSLDLGDLGRALAAFTLLLHQGALAAQQEGSTEPAAALIRSLECHPELLPHLPAAKQFPPPKRGPVRLYAELSLSPETLQPVLRRNWVQHQSTLVMGGEPPQADSLGEQLQMLADAIDNPEGRALHVELLAPLLALCKSSDSTGYQRDIDAFEGLESIAERRDARDHLALAWRWRDRLDATAKGHKDTEAALWRTRAPLITSSARRLTQVSCRFREMKETPGASDAASKAADDASLLGLAFVPLPPARSREHTAAFLAAMRLGAPYMLWPGDEDVTSDTFKEAVRHFIANKDIAELPEAIREARRNGQAKSIVLFMDDPNRNPYELMGRLTADDPPA